MNLSNHCSYHQERLGGIGICVNDSWTKSDGGMYAALSFFVGDDHVSFEKRGMVNQLHVWAYSDYTAFDSAQKAYASAADIFSGSAYNDFLEKYAKTEYVDLPGGYFAHKVIYPITASIKREYGAPVDFDDIDTLYCHYSIGRGSMAICRVKYMEECGSDANRGFWDMDSALGFDSFCESIQP